MGFVRKFEGVARWHTLVVSNRWTRKFNGSKSCRESLASARNLSISITTMSKCPQPRQQHQKWLRILYSVLTSNNFTFESFALQKTFQYFSSSLRFFLSACYYFFPFYSALGCAPFAQHNRAMRYLICSYFYYLFSSSLRSYDFLFSRDGLSAEIAFCCAMMCSGNARWRRKVSIDKVLGWPGE